MSKMFLTNYARELSTEQKLCAKRATNFKILVTKCKIRLSMASVAYKISRADCNMSKELLLVNLSLDGTPALLEFYDRLSFKLGYRGTPLEGIRQ